jgi:CBS domain-containing protein
MKDEGSALTNAMLKPTLWRGDEMKIRNILDAKGALVITIRPEQTLKEAVALLAKHRIGALVVVDDSGNLAGILSERDIIRQAAEKDIHLTLPVSKVMTKTVTTGTLQDDPISVLQTMTDRHFRHLPILEQGKLAGIISIGDVAKAIFI